MFMFSHFAIIMSAVKKTTPKTLSTSNVPFLVLQGVVVGPKNTGSVAGAIANELLRLAIKKFTLNQKKS
jgi:hypothetical protein